MSGSYGALNSKYLTLQAQLNALGGSIGGSTTLEEAITNGSGVATSSFKIQDTPLNYSQMGSGGFATQTNDLSITIIPNQVSVYDNFYGMMGGSLIIERNKFQIGNDAGVAGQAIGKDETGNLAWITAGGGGTPSLNAVMAEGNNTSDQSITLQDNETDEGYKLNLLPGGVLYKYYNPTTNVLDNQGSASAFGFTAQTGDLATTGTSIEALPSGLTILDKTPTTNNSVVISSKQIGIGVAGVVDYGTVGQVLTSGGEGNLSWGGTLADYLTTATASSTYQTIADMTNYLTTATASLTYQTIADMTNYLTTATASATYQTIADMTNYLTTATASATYQTLAGMSSYLTTATASATYQTLAGMSSYLTTATASATYQTLAGMSSYLTTATASSTYQTLAGMSSYLTTATASATYATIASLSAYAQTTGTNVWTGTNTFNEGISLAPSRYITTGGGAGAPSATQIGGEVVGTIVNPLPSNLSSNGWYSVGENLSLSSGVWLIYGVITIGTLQDATDFKLAFGFSKRTGGATNTGAFDVAISTNYVNLVIPQNLNINAVYRNETANPVSVFFNVRSTSPGNTPVASSISFLFKAYKLA